MASNFRSFTLLLFFHLFPTAAAAAGTVDAGADIDANANVVVANTVRFGCYHIW